MRLHPYCFCWCSWLATGLTDSTVSNKRRRSPMNDVILFAFVPSYAAISSKVAQHRREEQQQVDALLASQKHLTSNLRTLINSECIASGTQQAQHTLMRVRTSPFLWSASPPPRCDCVHACQLWGTALTRSCRALQAVLQNQVLLALKQQDVVSSHLCPPPLFRNQV